MPTITVPATDRRVYVQVTHPFTADVPNVAGVATVANGDFVPCSAIEASEEAAVIPSTAMTGGQGRVIGITGRRTGRWSADFPLQPSGAAGTVPNLDPVLQALFGQAPTIVAATSVTYSFAPTGVVSSLTIWIFSVNEAGVQQRCIRGAVVDQCAISTGDGELVLRVSGPCAGIFDSVNFATYHAAGETGGVDTFPNEPPAPAAIGVSIGAFVGGITIDGTNEGDNTFGIDQFAVDIRTNRALLFAFGKRAARIPNNNDRRDCKFTLGLFEQNTNAVNALRLKPFTRATSSVDLKFGESVGGYTKFQFRQVLWPAETLDNSNNRSVVRYNGAQAHTTGPFANDELSLVLT